VPLAVPVALQGIADRLGALGGTIDIAAAPDRGTRLTGRVPAAAA
jgi:signal transduction histidine kinase